MIEEGIDKYMIHLKDCVEQEKYELIKDKISKFPKYFYDIRSKTLLIYDHTCIYIVSRQQTKITDLGKQHPIVQLSYNPTKNILVFLTHDGHLIAHFVTHKTQLVIKKDFKKESMFGWIIGNPNIDFFIAEHSNIRLFKIDEEKKAFKQVKSISGKFNSFLYEPLSQTLVCFPTGDCKTVSTFLFDDENKAKNWFKGPQISINFDCDENLKALVKKTKSLGLKSSRIFYQLFHKQIPQQFAAQIIKLNNKCYLVFYFGSQGKLKLVGISDEAQKQITIKLPSDCLPSFVVVDNMLVIHMKNEKITFIYDINNAAAQMLVSPFPVQHKTRNISPYAGVFIGNRHVMPDGNISKWEVNTSVIFHYLKNEMQLFQYLLKREKAKPELLKWLRQNLLRTKQINLSKFWKMIFIKIANSPQKQNNDTLTLAEVYANVFYTLFMDELTPKQPLANIILECIRQAKQMQIKIPTDLQKLLFDVLLICKKYQTLVFLCHNDVIKDSQQLVQALMRKANKQNQQILLTLAIDMGNRVCKPQKMFEMLILSQRIWEARRFLKQNYENIEVLYMIYASKGIRNETTRKEYLKLTRNFILKKFPSITDKYLDEAEYNVYQKEFESNKLNAKIQIQKTKQQETKQGPQQNTINSKNQDLLS